MSSNDIKAGQSGRESARNMSGDAIKAFRPGLPHAGRVRPWLAWLLDCYALIDFSVAEAIKQATGQAAGKVACHKGCAACCSQVIPLSTIEGLGLKYYAQNILAPQDLALLREKINGELATCLFNIDGSCVVYPLRPIACRRYIVCSQPCAENENPAITRPGDVLEPSREYFYQAIALTLPFYKGQNIALRDDENIFAFYARQNVKLSSIYANIIQ